MKTRIFLIAAICALMACSKENGEAPGPGNEPGGGSGDGSGNEPDQELAISFTADIPAFVEGGSRATVDNDWKDLKNRTVSVAIDDVVKTYTIDEKGNMTAELPFYWEGRENVTVSAWYPSTEGGKLADEALKVMADQSKPENFAGSDYLEVVAAKVTPASSVLSFSHRVSKLVCSLSFEEQEVKNAVIRFLNLNQVQEGTSVTAMASGNALVVPQRIPAGQEFVEVTLPEYNNLQAIAAPHEDLVFEKGKIYYLDVDVSKEGVAEVIISSSASWGNNEIISVPGTSTDVKPSPGQPGWGEGDKDTSISGESSEVTPSPGNSGWEEGDKDTDISGESSEITPSPGSSPNWGDGGKTDVPGSSTSMNPSPVTPPNRTSVETELKGEEKQSGNSENESTDK